MPVRDEEIVREVMRKWEKVHRGEGGVRFYSRNFMLTFWKSLDLFPSPI